MTELATCVQSYLQKYYEEVQMKVHQWVDPLSSEQLWERPFAFGNSVGHLLLHMTGNLNHYIGAQIGGTGYIRTRDVEFNDDRKLPKEKVMADFDGTIAMVVGIIRQQTADDWAKPCSTEGETVELDRFSSLFRCAAHAYHHVGQIIYLTKELNIQKSPE